MRPEWKKGQISQCATFSAPFWITWFIQVEAHSAKKKSFSAFPLPTPKLRARLTWSCAATRQLQMLTRSFKLFFNLLSWAGWWSSEFVCEWAVNEIVNIGGRINHSNFSTAQIDGKTPRLNPCQNDHAISVFPAAAADCCRRFFSSQFLVRHFHPQHWLQFVSSAAAKRRWWRRLAREMKSN